MQCLLLVVSLWCFVGCTHFGSIFRSHSLFSRLETSTTEQIVLTAGKAAVVLDISDFMLTGTLGDFFFFRLCRSGQLIYTLNEENPVWTTLQPGDLLIIGGIKSKVMLDAAMPECPAVGTHPEWISGSTIPADIYAISIVSAPFLHPVAGIPSAITLITEPVPVVAFVPGPAKLEAVDCLLRRLPTKELYTNLDLLSDHLRRYQLVYPYWGEQKCALEQFDIQRAIGRGSQGLVKRAVHRPTGEKVVIKLYHESNSMKTYELIRREEIFASRINHQNVGHLFCSFIEGDQVGLVYPYLGRNLTGISSLGLSMREKAEIFLQIVQTLGFLHSCGIIHRDIKPGNILYSSGQVSLIDFGHATEELPDSMDDCFGTPGFLAPEALEGEDYDDGVDWYAVGVTLCEVIMEDVCEKRLVTGEAKADDLIAKLTKKDRRLRLSYANGNYNEIVDHLFFASARKVKRSG